MKTTLRQQVELVNEILKEPSKPRQVKLVRAFLVDNGYEDIGECKHYTVIRRTGRCAVSSCNAQVAEPLVLDSDEAIETLRERLRG
jgi:hypothetical protein